MTKSAFIKLAQAKWRKKENLKYLIQNLPTHNYTGIRPNISVHKREIAKTLNNPIDRLNLTQPQIQEKYEWLKDKHKWWKEQPQPTPLPKFFPKQIKSEDLAKNLIEEGELQKSDYNFLKRYTKDATPEKLKGLLYRGVSLPPQIAKSFVPSSNNIAWGGGYFNGALLHASPSVYVAEEYGLQGGRKRGLSIINTYKEAPGQKFGPDYSLEQKALNPRIPQDIKTIDSITSPSQAYETALDKNQNKFLGTILHDTQYSASSGEFGFIPSEDKKGMRALGHYMKNMAETFTGAEMDKPDALGSYLDQWKIHPRLTKLSQTHPDVFKRLLQKRVSRYLHPSSVNAPTTLIDSIKPSSPATKSEVPIVKNNKLPFSKIIKNVFNIIKNK